MTVAEDRSRVPCGQLPQVMAAGRQTMGRLLRRAGLPTSPLHVTDWRHNQHGLWRAVVSQLEH